MNKDRRGKMELKELLDIYNDYNKRINDLWRSL